jgi:hypothetical protein
MRRLTCKAVLAALLLSHSTGAFADSRYFPQAAIEAWHGQRFTVQRIEFLDEDSLERQNLEAWLNGNADEIEQLQIAVRANPDFRKALAAQSVQLNNVVAISRALNGNLVVYLR